MRLALLFLLLSLRVPASAQGGSPSLAGASHDLASESIPHLKLSGSSFEEALSTIRKCWEESHPGESFPVAVTDFGTPDGYEAERPARISLDLKEVPYLEALRHIAVLSGRNLEDGDGLFRIVGRSWIDEGWNTRTHPVSAEALAALGLAPDASAGDVREAFARLAVPVGTWLKSGPILEGKQWVLTANPDQQEVAAGLLHLLSQGYEIRPPAASVLRDTEVVLTLEVSGNNPRNTEGDFVALKDGRLLHVYTRFTGGGSDHDRADLVSRFSADGGLTWSSADETVVANRGGLNVMSVSTLRLADGRIALVYLEKNSLTDCRPVIRFSNDEAESWSDPVGIIPDDETGYYVLNNDRVVQLSGGRLLAPLALHHRPDWEKPDWNGEIGVYFSDDGGATWSRSLDWKQAHDAAGKRVATQEPGVFERLDGSVLMFIRTGAGELYQSHSTDRGLTWSDPEPMGVATPQSPASIERMPGGDTLVMVWNDHSALPVSERKARTPLSLALSRDEGLTWSKGFVLEPDPKGWYCYTAMEFVGDDLFLGYVAGTQDPGKHLSASRVRRVGLGQFGSIRD